MTIKIAINGAAGRMGRALAQALESDDALVLAAAFEHADSEALGAAVGEQVIKIQASDSIADGEFDVLIDFTTPESTLAAVGACRNAGRAVVIGTTGCSAEQVEQIEAAGSEIPIVMAPNFSVGVNVSFKLIEMAAKVLGEDADIEVIGAHHRHKADSPSGTALAMGRAAADALGLDLEKSAVYGREGRHGERPKNQIGFSTIHAGDIVGEHTVMFAGEGERVEITHKASERAIFARGALRAAAWVQNREPGFYTMQDVLGLAN